MTDSEDDLLREMEELRQGFLAGLPPRLVELRVALDALASSVAKGFEPSVLELLRGSAHKLRGTAGCYGEDGLSDAAGALEDEVLRFLREHEAANEASRANTVDVLRDHMASLDALCRTLIQPNDRPDGGAG
jgi:chemotaxis protein histidine kinase CheA